MSIANYFQNEWKQKILSPFPHLQKYKHKMPKIIIWIANDMDMRLAMRWFCEDVDEHFEEYETTYPMMYDDVIECVMIYDDYIWENHITIYRTCYCRPHIYDKYVFRDNNYLNIHTSRLMPRKIEENKGHEERIMNYIALCVSHQSIYTNYYTTCMFLATICETHNDKNQMQNYRDWTNIGKILADEHIVKTICKF